MSYTELSKNFVDGKWIESSVGTSIAVHDPATGEVIANVAEAHVEEVDLAVDAANRVLRDRILIDMHPYDRGRLIFRIADALEQRSEEVALSNCYDTGKALKHAQDEVKTALRYLRYYGGLADKIEGRSIPRGAGLVNYTTRIPYGVSAQIVPWNGPLELAARSLACALATGNSVVIKAPELAPLSCFHLAKACEEAGIPDGAVNVLVGLGHTAGAALTRHDDVHHIVFTGSMVTGQRVLKAAADRIVPCIMELGGKSAAIIYEDANIDDVVEAVQTGTFVSNAGQNCNGLSRLIAHRSIVNDISSRLETLVHSLTIGPGIDNSDITPVISDRQRQSIVDACKRAELDGARLVVGGKTLDTRSGYFFPATVFDNVERTSSIFQREVFGPVLAITAFDTPEEAVELANGTDQGLAAGVFSKDIDLALWTADRLWAGQVYVNGWFVGGVETPFGGMKKSGYGREKGQEALDGYVQTRNVGIRVSSP